MSSRRGLLILALPLIGLGLLVSAVVMNRRPALGATGRARPAASSPRTPTPPAVPAAHARAPAMRAATLEDASERRRVETTYLSYRTALATGNRRLADTLRKALLRSRETAVSFAERELAYATTEVDRALAEQTLEALKR